MDKLKIPKRKGRPKRGSKYSRRKLSEIPREPLPVYDEDLWFIEDLGLNTRTYNALLRVWHRNVREVYEMSDEELLGIKGLGRGCLKDLREKLEKFRQKLLNAEIVL